MSAPSKGECVIIAAKVSDIKAVGLSPDEELRASSMLSEEARACFLAGRYLTRGVLAHWLGKNPQDISFALSASGKPFFLQEEPLHFSISHSGPLVGVAFSSQEVGLDLECQRPLDTTALARRFFSHEEAEILKKSGDPGIFFCLWTCREAAIKADGRGLGALLASTRVIHPAEARIGEKVQVEIEGKEWCSIPWILSCCTHVAVAFRESPCVIRWCDLR